MVINISSMPADHNVTKRAYGESKNPLLLSGKLSQKVVNRGMVFSGKLIKIMQNCCLAKSRFVRVQRLGHDFKASAQRARLQQRG